MGNDTDVKEYMILAAVLRKRGGRLRIETLDLEGPRDDEVLVRRFARNPSSVCFAGTARCNRSTVTISSLRIFRRCSFTSLGVGWKSPRETPLE